MTDRFQISKVNGGGPGVGDFEPTNITTISENVTSDNSVNNANGSAPPPAGGGHYQQHNAPRKSSRISFRGFGSFLRSKQSADDRKFSLAQLTQ